MKTLLIRVDASLLIGTGHVMRCLALAQAWQDTGGRAIFGMALESQSLEARLREEAMDIIHLPEKPGSIDDALQTTDFALNERATWVVVDGYQFNAEYQRIIKDAGLNLLFIDDYGHADHYYADLILNQNIYSHGGLYANREAYVRLLLGTKYVLLRREFSKWQNWKRDIKETAGKVLVTLGGADPDNVTLKIVKSLNKLNNSNIEVEIVVGPSNPNIETLNKALLSGPCTMSILQNVDNMPELMAWADVAISAGGSTCWEMAYMGLPFLTIVLSDNQKDIARGLNEIEIAENLGWSYDLSEDHIIRSLSDIITNRKRRLRFSNNGNSLVDQQGAARIIQHITKG